MELRYLLGKETDPYTNLATEAELMHHVESGMAILFLWQNDNTIVIGRNQDVYTECRVNEFMAQNGKIARRRSGGGAVFHDLGNLNFSIICKKAYIGSYIYHVLVKRVLENYGINAEFNGRNDLLWCDRKFSGSAVYDDGEIVCQHGTILVNSSIDKMQKYLTPDKGKLDRNHVSSVESRVVNLGEISEVITVDSLKKTFIESLEAEQLDYTPECREHYRDFFSSESWIYGGVR